MRQRVIGMSNSWGGVRFSWTNKHHNWDLIGPKQEEWTNQVPILFRLFIGQLILGLDGLRVTTARGSFRNYRRWVSGVPHPLRVKNRGEGAEKKNRVTTDSPKSWRLRSVEKGRMCILWCVCQTQVYSIESTRRVVQAGSIENRLSDLSLEPGKQPNKMLLVPLYCLFTPWAHLRRVRRSFL